MGGGVPSAALARRVGRENGGSSGGAMPAGTDRSRTRAASAYSGANRPGIPVESGQVFRANPATDSG
jgi:hypothetical protein